MYCRLLTVTFSMNRVIFLHLHKNGSVAHPGSSIGKSVVIIKINSRWGKTSHFSVSKLVLTGFATTVACCCRFSFKGLFKRINCKRQRSFVMVSLGLSLRSSYSTLHPADPYKYRSYMW